VGGTRRTHPGGPAGGPAVASSPCGQNGQAFETAIQAAFVTRRGGEARRQAARLQHSAWLNGRGQQPARSWAAGPWRSPPQPRRRARCPGCCERSCGFSIRCKPLYYGSNESRWRRNGDVKNALYEKCNLVIKYKGTFTRRPINFIIQP